MGLFTMYEARTVPEDLRLSAAQVRAIDASLHAMRDQLFPQDYFVASPWRLLLDIEQATFAGTPFPGAGTGALPTTTALRYIAIFERDGLVERRVDPNGTGKDMVVLTSKGAGKLNAIFEQVALALNDRS